jgi:predicted Zn-dependent protease
MKEELDVLRSSQQESEALLQATASLIAAYQAADQLANARAYLDLAREHFPEDGGIRDLELMQIYREGNLELAEEMLRERLEAEPEDVLTRLNLAILLHERGHPGSMREAKSLAAVLVAEQPESALGLRAQKILE